MLPVGFGLFGDGLDGLVGMRRSPDTGGGFDRVMQAVEAKIASVRRGTDVLSTVGSGSILGVNTGYVYVRPEDCEKRRFSLGRLFCEAWAGRRYPSC